MEGGPVQRFVAGGGADGAGGEIRDEGATGRGSRPKAGLTGFTVSRMDLDGSGTGYGKPAHIASPLQIMIEGPLGGAAFNNEFGRPNLLGYFREYEQTAASSADTVRRGYHKPIMLAGGLGSIDARLTHKQLFPSGSLLIQLGGPGMRIGLGGSAASSMATGTNATALDFDSVQRDNPEMQRRAQEVINHCQALGEENPVLAIHDVGTGGLSNAFPELANDAGRGARFDLRAVPLDESGMSPREIWCNESQERYVLAIAPASLAQFSALCARERCPFAVIGVATEERELRVLDEGQVTPVAMPMDVLLGKPPRMQRNVRGVARRFAPLDLSACDLQHAVIAVLSHPTVASKRFLITIGDRTVGGLTHRDQMVGPWQVPVADCAVTLADFRGWRGETMAIGERSPLAVIDAPASGRMAVAEAITNLLAAPIDLARVKLSANWMAAYGEPGEDADLYATVRAVGMELCPALGISIPVGKDSLSMRTQWVDAQGGGARKVTSPVSLVVSAFATLDDVRGTLTPQLDARAADSTLVLVDLGRGRQHPGAGRSGSRPQPHGWQHPGADAGADRRCRSRSGRYAGSGGTGTRRQCLARPGPAAGLPRPQRWRSACHGLRDGVCRQAGRCAQRRPAGHRGRRHQRQPRRIRRQQELGGPGAGTARRAHAQGLVQRRTGCRAADPQRRPQRGDAAAARPWPEPAQPLRGQDPADGFGDGLGCWRTAGLARCQDGVQRAAA
jgi:phosphoribosylformylglycinamidine synthase